MRWTPEEQSPDLEDQRGSSGGGGGGGFGLPHLGIGGFVVVLLLSLVFHRNFFAFFSGGGGAPGGAPPMPPGPPMPLGLNEESVANTLVPSEDELMITRSPLFSALSVLDFPSSVTVASEGIVIVGVP